MFSADCFSNSFTLPQLPLMKTFFTLTLLCSFVVSQAWAQSNFVALDQNGLGTSTLVKPQSLRMWDTGTTWANLNPGPGTYNWAPLDKMLANAKTLGITELLLTLSNTPQWASSGSNATCKQGHNLYGCSPPSDVNSTDQHWQDFVTALLSHTGTRIQTFEMWNEPGWTSHYNGTYAQMARMVTDACRLIHGAGLKCGTPPNQAQFGYQMKWWNGFAAAGGLNSVDVVTFHGYTNHYPLVCGTFPIATEVSAHVSNLNALMAKYGVSKPLWDTEGSWGPASKTCFTNQTAQASWLTQFYSTQASLGVERVYWYAFAGDWGALTANGKLLPSGAAYNQLPRK
jgi:hypothetical protein